MVREVGWSRQIALDALYVRPVRALLGASAWCEMSGRSVLRRATHPARCISAPIASKFDPFRFY